jgi:hypothetical protein
MPSVRSIVSFLRWRLIPVRYLGRLIRMRPKNLRRSQPISLDVSKEVARAGFAPGPQLSKQRLEEISLRYDSRIKRVERQASGHPFVNLVTDDDIRSDLSIWQFVFSPEVIDVAKDYFGGFCFLDSVQILYSWPTEGATRASQKWHKDYGDSKSLHFIIYLKDVLNPEDGPFVFVDKQDTMSIDKKLYIRRIEDSAFEEELNGGKIREFYGNAGESLIMDPAVCYHYGSRCKSPDGRLALFVTFNSTLPFESSHPLITRNGAEIFEIGQELRPDLGNAFLRALTAT